MAKKKHISELQAKKEAAILAERATKHDEATRRVDLERIIKTTESMNIVVGSGILKNQEQSAASKTQAAELAGIREAISRSYELARRKITAEYERVILANDYVDSPFIAVQVTIRNLDHGWKIEVVENTIKKFNDAVLEQIALGRTVYLSDSLVIEPVVYVDRILPAWRSTPKFAVLANAISWEEICANLIKSGEISREDAGAIIREGITAMSTNVANGYIVKISRIIIMQISSNNEQRIILFSNDTLEKMNEIYLRYIKTGEGKKIRKYDAIIHFDKTLENVEKGFYSEDVKAPVLAPEFVPRDLTQEIKVDKRKATKEVERPTTASKDKEQSKTKLLASKKPASQTATNTSLKVKEEVKIASATKPSAPVSSSATSTSSKKASITPKRRTRSKRSKTQAKPQEKALATSSTAPKVVLPTLKPQAQVINSAPVQKPIVKPTVLANTSGATKKPTPTKVSKPKAQKPDVSQLVARPVSITSTAPKTAVLKPVVKPAASSAAPVVSSSPSAPKPAATIVKPVAQQAPKKVAPKVKKVVKKPVVVSKPTDRVETFSYTTINDTSLHKIIDEDKASSPKPRKK